MVDVTRRMRKKIQRRLISAVMFGEARHVARWLRSGADPNFRDRDHGTPLYQAGIYGRADVVRMLVRAGADPNTESAGLGSDGLPLCAAACWGHIDAVRELLAAGADPTAREDHGEGLTAAEWAVRGGWTAVVTILHTAAAASRPAQSVG
jgi:ankyrin repeat protein